MGAEIHAESVTYIYTLRFAAPRRRGQEFLAHSNKTATALRICVTLVDCSSISSESLPLWWFNDRRQTASQRKGPTRMLSKRSQHTATPLARQIASLNNYFPRCILCCGSSCSSSSCCCFIGDSSVSLILSLKV